ncbi:MAG: Uma2 family endonuclease [Selenomonadaceae bacterium]|nr:Uma2 family endonuclease [Selenomonadaceae bacterium]
MSKSAHPYDLEDANDPYVPYELLDGVQYGEPPYEILGGKKVIMSPSPKYNHCSLVTMICTIFTNYILEKKINATVLGDNFDVYFSTKYHCKPDVSVICDRKRLRNGKRLYNAPDLAVEVISKSSEKIDTGEKKEKYEEYGVREYWIVDPDKKSIQVYHLVNGNFLDSGKYNFDGSGAGDKIDVSIFEDLIVDLKLVFKFVIDEEDDEEIIEE